MSADDDSPARVDRRGVASVFTLVLILLGAGWWLMPILDSGFLTDDFQVLHKVAEAVDGADGDAHPVRGLSRFYVRAADERFQLYRPSVLVSYGLTLLSNGVAPRPFQITNWCAHLLSAVLVFLLLKTVLTRIGVVGSALATSWFLVSPLQLEVLAWSASRSEWISFLCGTGAVVIALRRPGRRLVPGCLVVLALTAKETAIVYPLALTVLEWTRPIEGRPNDQNLRKAMMGSWGWAALLGGYFLLRWVIFGSVFSVDYNNRSVGSYFELATLAGIARSSWRMLAPLSEDVFTSSAQYWSTAVLSAVAAGIGLFDGLRVLAHRRGLIALSAVLIFVPLGMSLPFNEITAKLVNTRALYSSMAVFAVLLAAGTMSRHGVVRRFSPLLVLVVIGVIASRPGQRQYIDAAQRIDAPLATVRAGMGVLSNQDVGTIALLGYPFPEPAYFGGGFTMAGAIRPALSRPFLARDYWIEKVASDEAPSNDYRGFEELLRGDTSTIAMFMFRSEVAGGPIAARRISLGRYSGDGRTTLRPIAPEALTVHGLDAAVPSSLAPAFEVALVGEVERFTFRFIKANHVVAEVPFSIAEAEVTAMENGQRRVRFVPPAIPAAALPALDARQVIGWSIQGLDAKGEIVAETEIRGLIVEKRP